MTFTVRRLIGAGDLQHVRYALLQVAALDPLHVVEQAEAAFALGTHLNMMTRLHINCDVLDEHTRHEVLRVFYANQAHQLEQWSGLTTAQLAKKVSGCELFIETQTTKPHTRVTETTVSAMATPDTLFDTMLHVWEATGGRVFNGNFGRLDKASLEKLQPTIAGEVT